MKNNYKEAIEAVFKHEGGYVNHPSDPGGPTNRGITLATAKAYWKSDVTATDMRTMTKAVAEDIYRKHYANPVQFDAIAPGLDYCTLDAAINSGVGRADDWLAYALETENTGYKSLAKRSHECKDLIKAIKRYQAKRLSFLRGLRTWGTFGKGWSRRVQEVEALALRIALEASRKPTGELKEEAGRVIAQTNKNASVTFLGALGGIVASVGAAWTLLPLWGQIVISAVGVLLGLAAIEYFMYKRNQIREYRKQFAKLS